LLAAIQSKPSLKKAADRKLAVPKPEANGKSDGGGGMMSTALSFLAIMLSLALTNSQI
jgi:hypothetical protein